MKDLSLTGTRLGNYSIEGLLGQGGMGRVYRALQHGPGGFTRPVAIKVLRDPGQQLIKDADETMAREARTVARLQHRNIVQVLDYVCEQGIDMLVLELVDGVTLKTLLRASSASGTPRRATPIRSSS